jgi:hypothetical protein
MCKISYKSVKNESNQFIANICKPNLAYFTSMYSVKNWLKMIAKNLPYQTVLLNRNKNVKCITAKYL